MSRRYLIAIAETSTGYSAYSPDVPGCVADRANAGRGPGQHA
jgi:predicted RNase H-like HicB family nuclease